ITRNTKLLQIFRYVESIATTAEPVLITGETGVGKDLLAQAIHVLSNRQGSLVAVNVAGLDDAIFSDTLFGHSKGAFTGAERVRKGLIEQASGGTLFLDEIGDLTAASQSKLLRLLQSNDYFPLGSDMPKHSHARVVSATNRNLWQLAKEEKFRKDLNYRLRTHHLHIPPLRERLDD
ncbi:MAG: sigma-54 factor interaction domain-containing protein, partial [Planctomycetes bacterium]|nr:sigma-54 factor interaction domain-containing protein [Planctomycetota bacterium]